MVQLSPQANQAGQFSEKWGIQIDPHLILTTSMNERLYLAPFIETKCSPGSLRYKMAPKYPSVAVHGCYHNLNFGDMLMYELLCEHVNTTFCINPVVPWVHPRRQDQFEFAGHGMSSVFRASAAILGGGGYLHDNNGDKKSRRRLLRYTGPAAVWRTLRTPYAIIGVGGGPTLAGVGAKRVKAMCDGADVISVRDEETYSLLRSIGVKTGMEVTADLVACLQLDQVPSASQEKASLLLGEKIQGKTYCGIHFQSLYEHPQLLDEALLKLKDFTERHQDFQVVWIYDHFPPDSVDQHNALIKERIPSAIIIDPQDVWTTVSILNQLDAVITSKLHVGITAWSLKVPAFGFSTHPKSQRFYRQVGYSQRQAEASPKSIDMLDRWLEEIASASGRLAEDDAMARQRAVVRSQSQKNYKLIDQFLLDNGFVLRQEVDHSATI